MNQFSGIGDCEIDERGIPVIKDEILELKLTAQKNAAQSLPSEVAA